MMPIVLKSDKKIRKEVMEYLKEKRRSNPNYRVLDIGGARNPWCDRYVDAYVDINDFESDIELILGDINDAAVWDEIARGKWNFIICTHTLEDIRRPDFVIENMIMHCGAGFIAVPNKHTELSSLSSSVYTGYCHHRWIFTLKEGSLGIIAKWPGTAYFSSSFKILRLLGRTRLLRKAIRMFGFRPGGGDLKWLDKSKADPHEYELGFIWESSFDFNFINNDYAGDSEEDMMRLYYEELEEGL